MTDTTTLNVVSGGTITDAILVPASAVISTDGKSASWDETTFDAPSGSTFAEIQSGVIGYRWDGKTLTPPAAPPLPPSSPQTVFAPRDFMALFTAAEQSAIFKARQTSVEVDMFVTLAMAGSVDLTNTEVISDVNTLVSAGLLTQARATAILAGTAPPLASSAGATGASGSAS